MANNGEHTGLKAPFPWFGGKRKVAAEVWSAFGDVQSYVEPFAGSLAVLLERPTWHAGTTETINDADRFVSNFWRALTHDPDTVAHYADWPVNECDLESRHLWLVNEGLRRMADNLWLDPDWYDAQIAGWWLWGICAWIGSGWCSGNGPHTYDTLQNGSLTVGNAGQGVKRQRPHLGNAGQGVNRKLPHLGDAGQGVRYEALYAYMHELAARLRHVRVCCGDWSRVVTGGALNHGATVGIFLDPPYSDAAGRDANLYAVDDLNVAHDVRAWCIANGDNPRYRIVLAGYADEHDAEMPATWRRMAWTAGKAYGTSQSAGRRNDANRHEEMLWMSPHCLQPQRTLFDLEFN